MKATLKTYKSQLEEIILLLNKMRDHVPDFYAELPINKKFYLSVLEKTRVKLLELQSQPGHEVKINLNDAQVYVINVVLLDLPEDLLRNRTLVRLIIRQLDKAK